MKRIFSILLITALLVALVPLTTMTVALAETYATVTSSNGYGVRLREGPSKSYRSLGTFAVGSTAKVIQNGIGWSQIQIGNTIGWMMNEFLIFGATGSDVPATGTADAQVISDNGLRVWLRSSPGGTRLFLNAAGTPVTVLERGDEWCKVSINGAVGYMMTKYISIGSEGSSSDDSAFDVYIGPLQSASLNYPYPVVLDTLAVILEPENADVTYEWEVYNMLGSGTWEVLGTEPTFNVLTRYADCDIRVTVTGTNLTTGKLVLNTLAPVQIHTGIQSVALNKSTAPVVGDVLGAVLQPSSAEVDYSWRVGGVEVSTEPTYTVQEADIGKMIQLKVTGIAGYVGSAACSAAGNVVSDKQLQRVVLDDYTPVVGQIMTASLYPSGASGTWEWTVDGEVVSNLAGYIVGKFDLGRKITVTVTGTDGYTGVVSDTSRKVSSAELESVTITNPTTPMIGDVLYAQIKPDGATALYNWYYGDGLYFDTTSIPEVYLDPAMRLNLVGEQVYVEAVGTGVYGVDGDGKEGAVDKDGNPIRPVVVTSNKTDEVVTDLKITSVTIDNLNPVVGDTLSAWPEPFTDEVELHYTDFTYVWYIDNETEVITHTNEYKVKESDVGKVIRVKVIATAPCSGEVYSGYTAAVVGSAKLTGLTVWNGSTDTNASYISPEVGQTLWLELTPFAASDFCDVQWYRDTAPIPAAQGGNDWSYTVRSADMSRALSAKVTAQAASNYSGELTAYVAAVVDPTSFVGKVSLPQPAAGITPVYSASEDYVYVATVRWLDAHTMGKASLDQYGHFEPGVEYVAELTVTVLDGTSLFDAQLTGLPTGATWWQDGDVSNVFYIKYPATDHRQITDYFITGIERPTRNGPNSTTYYNSQMEGAGNVSWTWIEAFGIYQEAVAAIKLDPMSGYTLEGLTEDIFKVSGADSVSYAGYPADTVYATYKLDHELRIELEKNQVLLDGNNRRIVHCTAFLTNADEYALYSGGGVDWDIISPVVDATIIDANGTLVIGMNETPDRFITVRAKFTTLDGDEYEATADLELVSGTDTDTQLEATFTKYSLNMDVDTPTYFEAIVSNSKEGYEVMAINGFGNPLPVWPSGIGYMVEVPAADYTPQIVVTATSNEDHSVTCKMLVNVADPALGGGEESDYILFTRGVTRMARGTTEVFYAKHVKGDLEYACKLYYIRPDGTKVEFYGPLTVGDAYPFNSVTVEAVSEHDATKTSSLAVTIVNAEEMTSLEEGIMTLEVMGLDDGIATLDETGLDDGIATLDETGLDDGIATLDETGLDDGIATLDETGLDDGIATLDETGLDDGIATLDETGLDDGIMTLDETGLDDGIATLDETGLDDGIATLDETGLDDGIATLDETGLDDGIATLDETGLDDGIMLISDEDLEAGIMPLNELDLEETEGDVTVTEETTEETEEEITEVTITIAPTVETTEEATEETTEETTEEATEETTEETTEEATEETTEEIPDELTVTIKRTGTDEVVEEVVVETEEEEEEKKSSKRDQKSSEEELEEEIPDEELDALEGEDLGESVASEAGVKVRFVDAVSELRRGKSAQFTVEVEGSEQGVKWSVRRSKNADGKVVSTISEDGKLTISKAETAEKLIVVATLEDGSVRARWIVNVIAPKQGGSDDEPEADETVTDETVTEETTEETEETTDETLPEEEADTPAEEEAPAEEDDPVEGVKPESEGLTQEQLDQIEEDLRRLEEENSALNFF